jgi:hypothetical protein
LPPATSIADRYTLQRHLRRGLVCEVHEAVDAHSGDPVTAHCLLPALVRQPGLVAALAESLRRLRSVRHKNLATVLDVCADADQLVIVTELLDGSTLAELLARKQSANAPGLAPRSAFNIAGHLCNALAALHTAGAHGCLSLHGVTIAPSGRVTVSDAGLAHALAHAVRAGLCPAQPSTAPELLRGGTPTPASDVYSTGALLYQLLVGVAPAPGCRRPSEVVPGLAAALDELIGRAMLPDPARRPPSMEAFKKALAAAMQAEPGRAPAAAAAAAAAAPAASPTGSAAAAQPRAASAPGTPSLAQALASAGTAAAPLTETEERYLINRGKLDYGPFSWNQVVEQIRSGQIRPGELIIDKDTGQRCPVEQHPLLAELVEAAAQKRDEERRASAEASQAVQEKRRGLALYGFIGAGVLGLGAGAYFLVSKLSADSGAERSAAVAALEEASLNARISFPTVGTKSKRKTGKGGGARKAGADPGFDDTLDLDMAGDDEEESERLDAAQVNPVLQKNGGKLAGCLSSTRTRQASIDLIILGSGKVSAVRVNGETGTELAACVRRVLGAAQFPTFRGNRSKFNFDIDL